MSEIKQINTGVAEIIAVKVPEGASGYTFIGGKVIFDIRHGLQNKRIELPDGRFEILGLSDQLSEEVCRELVPIVSRHLTKPIYRDFIDGGKNTNKDGKKSTVIGYNSALKSFASLMQANGCYSVNPYGEMPVNKDFYWSYLADIEQWREAEANTGTWLILKRLS